MSLADVCAYCIPARFSEATVCAIYRWCYQCFGRKDLQQVAQICQLTLEETDRRAKEIALGCVQAKGRQRRNYRAMGQTNDWRSAQLEMDAPCYRALADLRRPLVVLTVHQGDYLAGLLSTLQLVPTQRGIHIIKLAESSKKEDEAYTHFRRFGHDLVVHRLSERPAKAIVRALKRQAILLTFVDVPRSFGTTADVNMFGLPFQLTVGPIAMARLAGANLLPLFSYYNEAQQPVVRANSLIPAYAAPGESKPPRVELLAQKLANSIELNLRTRSDQWEMWPVLADLLDTQRLDAQESAITTDERANLIARFKNLAPARHHTDHTAHEDQPKPS